jgi:hypothetical protein
MAEKRKCERKDGERDRRCAVNYTVEDIPIETKKRKCDCEG